MESKAAQKRNVLVVIVLCCFVAVGVLFSVKFFVHSQKEETPSLKPTTQESTVSDENTVYSSPIDFDSLTDENSDIYAWLDIPDTETSYPIFQHSSDDDYYLRKNIDKKYDHEGVLFTQCSYNSTSFDDPVTIIYGHNIKKDSKFGRLQEYYSSSEGIKNHSEIIVYMPDKELHYTVFAAVPYDDRHILYNYDFTDERIFRLFFDDILSVRSFESAFADDVSLNADDKVLILSTCMIGNKEERFLVCAKLGNVTPN